MAFRNPFGGRRKRVSFAENVTTAGEFQDFLMSGLNLASGGGIADINTRNLESSALSGSGARSNLEQSARNTSVSQRDPNSMTDIQRDGRNLRAGEIARPDQDQVELLTGLYKQRLNEIMTRRARPGFKQVS